MCKLSQHQQLIEMSTGVVLYPDIPWFQTTVDMKRMEVNSNDLQCLGRYLISEPSNRAQTKDSKI